jgi:hypothetical protein
MRACSAPTRARILRFGAEWRLVEMHSVLTEGRERVLAVVDDAA